MSDAAAFALGEAPAIYARHFTVSELKEITAFYRTPAGAKALTVIAESDGRGPAGSAGPCAVRHAEIRRGVH